MMLPPPPRSEADRDRVFKATPRAWQQKGPTVPTPPPIQMGSLVTQEVSSEHLGCQGSGRGKGLQDWTPQGLYPLCG